MFAAMRKACSAAAVLKAGILAQEAANGAEQEVLKPLLEPNNLQRILRARKFDAAESLELAVQILEWRIKERPDLMRASDELEKECCTGKARLGTDFDRHGRPILVLDSSAENTTDAKQQVRHVLYQMERVIRRMDASPNRDVAITRGRSSTTAGGASGAALPATPVFSAGAAVGSSADPSLLAATSL